MSEIRLLLTTGQQTSGLAQSRRLRIASSTNAKGLFCLARFCRGYLRTNFRGCRLVLRRRDTQFNLRQGTGGVGELTICVGDYFSQRILCRFRPLLGKPPTFRCTLAHCLGTSFDFLRVILDAAENFGCLIHQVEAPAPAPGREQNSVRFHCCERQAFLLVSHERTSAFVPDDIMNGYGKGTIKVRAQAGLSIGRFTPPVKNGFAFQRSTGAFLCCFPGGHRTCPYLLNTVEEQIATMFFIERHRIIVA